MTNKILFIFLLGFCFSAKAQWILDYQFNPPSSDYVTNITAVDTSAIWIFATTSPDSGKIYKKIGSSVSEVNSNGFFRPMDLKATGLNSAFIIAYPQKLYFTSNSGTTWLTRIDSSNSFSLSYTTSPRFPNYVAACYESAGFGSVLLLSRDNGTTWSMHYLNLPDLHFVAGVSITDTNHIFIGVSCQSSTCSDLSYIYSTDAGTNWQTRSFPLISNNTTILAPYFNIANTVGFAFSPAYYCYRYRSINGGLNWSDPEFYANGNEDGMAGFKNIDSTQAWFFSRTRDIYKSTNDGASWQAMTIALRDSERIACMDVVRKGNKYYAYLGTSMGAIYKLVEDILPIGIRTITNQVPQSFALHQNFPNPFNPTTKIRFDVPVNSGLMNQTSTKLTLFDITGKEVATLVNGQLRPGTYEVDWDASNYPSGTYFYTLESGNFKNTKKMVVIK